MPYNENEKQPFALVVENLNNMTKTVELSSAKCELFSGSLMNPFVKAPEYEKLNLSATDEIMHAEIKAEYQWVIDGKQGRTQLNR
ncbi:MAG: hypothetical protein ACI9QV_000080 [Methylophagaceae bacterium]